MDDFLHSILPHFPNAVQWMAWDPHSAFEAQCLQPSRFVYGTEEQPVLHFMSVKRFLKLVTAKEVYLGRLDSQADDPRDGLLPLAQADAPTGFNKDFCEKMNTVWDPQMQAEQNEIHRSLAFIHCWIMGHHETRYMWRKFNGGTGICLASTTASVLRSLCPFPRHLDIGWQRVVYGDDSEQLPHLSHSLSPAYKDKGYHLEDELRLVAELDVRSPEYRNEPRPPCQRVRVDMTQFAPSVILGPLMLNGHADALKRRLARWCPGMKIFRSSFTGSWFNPNLREMFVEKKFKIDVDDDINELP